MAKSTTTPTAKLAQEDARERAELVRLGLAKLSRGERLTPAERRAVEAWEREQLDRWGPQYTAAVPKKQYCDAVGIQQKVALEQSRRFDLPYHTAGKTVDLFAQLAAWHQWAAENKHLITRLIKSRQVAELVGEGESLEFWQTELVKEKALKERDLREERQSDLLPRDAVHELLLALVEALTRLGESYQRKESLTGEAAAAQLRQRLAEFSEQIETAFADDDRQAA